MAATGQAPIIIKRKKNVSAEGHHGGAWKVAYADFVTAMMAFFLMMWLLNATTEDQKQGLADYFSPAIPLSTESGGSQSMLSGQSIAAEGTLGLADNEAESEVLSAVEAMLTATSGESTVEDELLQHIKTRITDEGLIVDLFDLPGEPLFEPETATPTLLLSDLLAVVDDVFRETRNRVAVKGYVRSTAVVRRDHDAWPLSAARAEAVRVRLASGWTGEARLVRTEAHGDRAPALPDRMDVRNNRLEVILLRNVSR
ncbi:flagellar motor protein MotB [Palleronia sp.]|uniref:flagellar motor protein MotB n=1 Tax=Palleronia sp. TaxID=1940284 RepID=UPI0035C85ABE